MVDEARQTKRQCEQQMAELEGQMKDLMFFLKAQEEVSAAARSLGKKKKKNRA